MTLVMVWREDRSERVWIASDSRLSSAGYSGRIIHTDHGAKILEIPIALFGPQISEAPIKVSRLGFAYTGSSLVALQAYTGVLPLWSRLRSSNEQVFPTIRDFAEHLAIFLHRYANDVGSSGGVSACECILVGFEPASSSLVGWSIRCDPSTGSLLPQLRPLCLSSSDPVEIFGSGSVAAQAELDKFQLSDPNWKREPLFMIRTHLSGDTPSDVGGGVQLGMVTTAGFELFYDVRPFCAGDAVGRPLVEMNFRGFDVFDISRIGHAYTFLTGVD